MAVAIMDSGNTLNGIRAGDKLKVTDVFVHYTCCTKR